MKKWSINSLLILIIFIYSIFASRLNVEAYQETGIETNPTTSETIEIGSGSKTWNETIVYHSNYPDGTDYTYTINYRIKNYVDIFNSFNLIKSLEELNFAVPDGYTAKNPIWNTNKYGNGTGYNSGATFVFKTENNGKTTHLYAVWEKNYDIEKVTLTYDANGGVNAPSPQIVDKGDNITIKNKEEMIYNGYDFLGWSTDKNAVFADWIPGDIMTIRTNEIFYAVWKEKKRESLYRVEWYDASTLEEIKLPETRSSNIGEEVRVKESDKAISGYIFDENNKENILSTELESSGTILRLYFTKIGDIEEPENPNVPENSKNPETPENPDIPEEPITPEIPKDEKNPITSDSIIYTAVILIISSISFVLLIFNKNRVLRQKS